MASYLLKYSDRQHEFLRKESQALKKDNPGIAMADLFRAMVAAYESSPAVRKAVLKRL